MGVGKRGLTVEGVGVSVFVQFAEEFLSVAPDLGSVPGPYESLYLLPVSSVEFESYEGGG